RSPRAHFQLPAKDRFFSRFHFMLEVNPPQCRLMDMASRNGTLVNGKQVRQADLDDGDEIQAGPRFLRVVMEKADIPSLPGSNTPPAQPSPADPYGTLHPTSSGKRSILSPGLSARKLPAAPPTGTSVPARPAPESKGLPGFLSP